MQAMNLGIRAAPRYVLDPFFASVGSSGPGHGRDRLMEISERDIDDDERGSGLRRRPKLSMGNEQDSSSSRINGGCFFLFERRLSRTQGQVRVDAVGTS